MSQAVAVLKKKVFCAGCQVATDHSATVEKVERAELVLTCDKCQRQIKFPGDISKEDLKAALDAHAKENVGQVPAEDVSIATDHPVLKALAEL